MYENEKSLRDIENSMCLYLIAVNNCAIKVYRFIRFVKIDKNKQHRACGITHNAALLFNNLNDDWKVTLPELNEIAVPTFKIA